MRDEFVQSEAIVISKSKILDLLIIDIEKIKSRLSRLSDNNEKALMIKCMDQLEKEIPLCDVAGFEDYINCHNFNKYKAKRLVKVVDRNYIVQPSDVVEIRFNV